MPYHQGSYSPTINMPFFQSSLQHHSITTTNNNNFQHSNDLVGLKHKMDVEQILVRERNAGIALGLGRTTIDTSTIPIPAAAAGVQRGLNENSSSILSNMVMEENMILERRLLEMKQLQQKQNQLLMMLELQQQEQEQGRERLLIEEERRRAEETALLYSLVPKTKMADIC